MAGAHVLDVRCAAGAAVALESAFLTTGLPRDAALDAAARMAAAVRRQAAEPAFIGMIEGRAIVGLSATELAALAGSGTKLSTRDLSAAAAAGASGGTTVAGTLFLAGRAALRVAATGGIGGVHPRGTGTGPVDVSGDLHELARTTLVVVCSGAKAITDLPATFERLESLGVTVVGYGTDELPAFWCAASGLALPLAVETPEQVAGIWERARALGTPGAILVCVPPPREHSLDLDESRTALERALAEMRERGVRGPAVTPFLLARIAELTGGRSLRANLALLENNAAVAGAIARVIAAATPG